MLLGSRRTHTDREREYCHLCISVLFFFFEFPPIMQENNLEMITGLSFNLPPVLCGAKILSLD